MSIVGCNVIHNVTRNCRGTGTVFEATDRAITVGFPNGTNETDTVKFIFPDAFKKGHLIAADASSEEKIQEALRSLKCSICELENVRTEKIDGKWFCEKCKSKFVFTCSSCGDNHEISSMVRAWNEGRYQRRAFCKSCSDLKSFVCKHCNNRYVNEFRSPFSYEGKDLCRDCFDDIAHVCTFCNAVFDVDDGDYFEQDDGTVYVCPDCLEAQTFICQGCGERKLNTSRVDSKYIPSDKSICDECIWHCSICGVAFEDENRYSAFGSSFCPECWETHKKNCPRCGDVFVPDGTSDQYCPDCVDMNQYVDRLKKEDFKSRTYKSINYFSLENVNRCKLFTELYDYCQLLAGRQVYMREAGNPFQLLVLDLIPYKVVITYLQPGIKGAVKCSQNITMTEFRKRSGRVNVRNSIRQWLEGGSTYIETAAGKMKVLDYPVRLRVQTSHDKNYGKEWNGPGDYIEIGNYGDTTDFYIIGVLDET